MRFSTVAAPAALAFAVFAPAAAGAVTIDFQDLPSGVHNGPVVYADATFTSSSGSFYINGAGVSQDLCTYVGSCDADLTVDFTAAVSNLTFTTAGDDEASTIAYTVFFGMGGSVGGTFTNDGVFTSQDLHSFGALGDIIKITFTDNDGAGITYDNFTFNVVPGAVPEPASWALMIGGFAVAGAGLRRRKAVASFA